MAERSASPESDPNEGKRDKRRRVGDESTTEASVSPSSPSPSRPLPVSPCPPLPLGDDSEGQGHITVFPPHNMAEGLATSLESDPGEGRGDKRKRVDDDVLSTTESGTVDLSSSTSRPLIFSPSPPRPRFNHSEGDDSEIASAVPWTRMDEIPTAEEEATIQLGAVSINEGRSGELFMSRKEIGKGSNGTTVFEGLYDKQPVAVKRLVRGHLNVSFDVIYRLMAHYPHHPNTLEYYGVNFDLDFVYLALERCTCSLHDLVVALSDSNLSASYPPSMIKYKNNLESLRDTMDDVNLWTDGHPSPLLLKLMREVVSGLNHSHYLEIIHRDLKPQNILITGKPLVAKLSDIGISKWDKFSLGYHATCCGTSGWRAPEQLLNERQTSAMDLFSLGSVLFFCLTGGRHPFGEGEERDINIRNNKMDLSSVECMPEAHDLILRLLNPLPKLRPKASEVLHHPLFWSLEKRISFLVDTSDRIILEADTAPNSDLLGAMENTAPLVLDRNDFSRVRDLLQTVRNNWELYKVKDFPGPGPDGHDIYFTKRYPRLLIETYGVVSEFCKEEERFQEYFGRDAL